MLVTVSPHSASSPASVTYECEMSSCSSRGQCLPTNHSSVFCQVTTDQSEASTHLASSCSTLSSALAGSLTVTRRLLLVER